MWKKNKESKNMTRINDKVMYIKTLQAEIESIRAGVSDAAIAKNLDRLLDQVRFSDPMSHDSLKQIEEWIAEDVKALRGDIAGANAANAADRIDMIIKRLIERNAKCKIYMS
jgi:hypothetical protein